MHSVPLYTDTLTKYSTIFTKVFNLSVTGIKPVKTRPIVPLKLGYKLAYSSSFDTNISNV